MNETDGTLELTVRVLERVIINEDITFHVEVTTLNESAHGIIYLVTVLSFIVYMCFLSDIHSCFRLFRNIHNSDLLQ